MSWENAVAKRQVPKLGISRIARSGVLVSGPCEQTAAGFSGGCQAALQPVHRRATAQTVASNLSGYRSSFPQNGNFNWQSTQLPTVSQSDCFEGCIKVVHRDGGRQSHSIPIPRFEDGNFQNAPKALKDPLQLRSGSQAVDSINPDGCGSRSASWGTILVGVAHLLFCRQFEVAVDIAILSHALEEI